MTFELKIEPVAKPRMTQRDKWEKRPCTNRYWSYKDSLILEAKRNGLRNIPEMIKKLHFKISMPRSWSKAEKKAMNDKPHVSKPDLDNLLKGFQDCLCHTDQHIHTILSLSKTWAYEGLIIIEI